MQRELDTIEAEQEAIGRQMEEQGSILDVEGRRMEARQQPMEALGREMEAASKPMEAIGKEMEILGKQIEQGGDRRWRDPAGDRSGHRAWPGDAGAG